MRITFAQATNSTVNINTNNPAVGHGANQPVGVAIAAGEITIINDSDVDINSVANLDTIEIQDGSTATVTLGFSLANVVLTDGTLNLTVNDQDRCTGTLNFANGTHFILNSASGFDMTIVSPTGSTYVLYTRCTEVTSNEVMQLCYIADQLLSVEDYQFTHDDYSDLRKYDSFDNIDFLRDFMIDNNVNADV